MKKFFKIGSLGLIASAGAFAGGLTMPTVDYSDLYSAGTLAVGVAVVVMLVRRAIRLFH